VGACTAAYACAWYLLRGITVGDDSGELVQQSQRVLDMCRQGDQANTIGRALINRDTLQLSLALGLIGRVLRRCWIMGRHAACGGRAAYAAGACLLDGAPGLLRQCRLGIAALHCAIRVTVPQLKSGGLDAGSKAWGARSHCQVRMEVLMSVGGMRGSGRALRPCAASSAKKESGVWVESQLRSEPRLFQWFGCGLLEQLSLGGLERVCPFAASLRAVSWGRLAPGEVRWRGGSAAVSACGGWRLPG